MGSQTYPMYIGGRPETPNHDGIVRDPFTGATVGRVAMADPAAIERAIAAAAAATEAMAAWPSHARRDALRHAAARFEARADELASMVTAESGKPISASRGEVERLVETFAFAAEEATRIRGEIVPLDVTPRAEGYRGYVRRVPIGACGFITPFNFPLNLVAHKIAPAMAAGCPFVLKPAPATPISALLMAEVLAETGMPDGSWSIFPCDVAHADPLVTDDRLALLSFTGSDTVGRMLAERAGMKRLVMELGGNAACVLDAGTDLDDAVERLVVGGYAQAGQSCISVQRILVHASQYDDLRDRLVVRVRDLPTGDPRDPATVVGPMIDVAAAERLESWIRAAVDAGATVLVGGGRAGALHEATVIEGVPAGADLVAREAFGPVTVLERFEDFDDALDRVDASRYGLQAGIFTRDIDRMHAAWDRLHVGAVVINDVPSFRVDHMPYGGVKQSGLGREGVRDAIEHMTEPRMMIVRDRPRPGSP